jgi:uncharacterized protein (TIRG00374 family)
MSRRAQVVVGLILAAILLYLFFRQADLAAVGAHLRHADYALVGLACVLALLSMVQRAWRWHYLMAPLKRISLGPLLSCTFMGWAVTGLLPGRLGEVARAVLLGRRENVSKTATFATVVLERIFDLLTVLLMLAIYLVFFPLPTGLDSDGQAVIAAMRLTGLLAMLGVVAGVLTAVGAQLWPRRAESMMRRFLGLFPDRFASKLGKFGRNFLDGFAGIGQPRLLAAIFLNSLAVWGLILLSYYVLFRAFDLNLPFYAVLPLVVILVVGVLVPTPAAVGSFHKAAQIGLATLWGVPNDLAISYAIISHAVAFLPVTLVGVALWSRAGLSMGSIQSLDGDGQGEKATS